jgi:hypothetical protein
MASLTSANIRLIANWVEGEVYSKRRIAKRVEAFNGTAGGTTNLIPATAFGLRVIEEVTSAYDATTGGLVAMAPSPDGANVHTFIAVDDATGPADIPTIGDTPLGLYFTVKGY